MRIALTADPELPVPPKLYGGIERIVDMLAHGLARDGHEVTLFAHPDSATAGRLVPWPGRASQSAVDTLRNAATLSRAVATGRFDLVHSFSRLAYLAPILPLSVPKLMTYQREISPHTTGLAHRISRGTLEFTAVSRQMLAAASWPGVWHVVPNGVPLDRYDYRPDVAEQAPLVFLGRVEEIKGPHVAIEIAHRSGLPLVIAGNIPDGHRDWFAAHVAPHVDGVRVHYAGPVDDVQKNTLLGSARAFLMPILWEEPFGIVMAEAMACGTPVIGLRRGAVPEVVEHGVTGFVVDDVEAAVDAVGRIGAISRTACRVRAEHLYGDDVIIDAYCRVYAALTRRRIVAQNPDLGAR